jgi:hypothetical protein
MDLENRKVESALGAEREILVTQVKEPAGRGQGYHLRVFS